MASKRKNDAKEEPSGRDKKKQRMAVARTIAVQPAVSSSGNAIGEPSKAVTFDGLKELPTSIHVERFTEARAFEINAMQEAIHNAGASSTQRAWQALPRHLRRRAASHDARRVPLKLRDKARAEMDPVSRKDSHRSLPKRGKDKRTTRTESFIKRQQDKTWLETHIWHAKRMHMTNMWGHRLAVQPTEKSFRPSYRAAMHGSILHDASYYGFIELEGKETMLIALLEACCDPQGTSPGAARFLSGARVLDTHIYTPKSYPFDLIAPITVIWRPMPHVARSSSSNGTESIAQIGEPSAKRKKGKKANRVDKEKAPIQPSTMGQSGPDLERTVWVRVHPAAFDDVWGTLQAAASHAVNGVSNNALGESENEAVKLADLRGQLNVFEIMGPKANQVIRGAMSPIGENERDDFRKFWLLITDLQTSASVPRDMVIGFKVHDPRLKFPPKNAKAKLPKENSSHSLPSFIVSPSAELAESDIWEEAARHALQKPRYKKKDLDERRSKLLVPGTHLTPLRQDDRVSIILIQRSLELAVPHPGSPGIHGWTVILPAGWSMPFFSSLTYTGSRVGGQRERQTQAFESGIAYYPRDYPFTTAYQIYASHLEEEERGKWERTPPAKRASWEKLGTRSPWKPDWEVVLGLKGTTNGDDDLVPAQREPPNTRPGARMENKGRPWLLRGSEVSTMVAACFKLPNTSVGLMSEIDRRLMKRHQDLLPSTISTEELWNGALVRVQVKMYNRGSPGSMAAIYCMEDEEASKWLTAATGHPGGEDMEQVQLGRLKPSQDSIIGYITTGDFSLARGEAFGIGAIALSRLYELQQQASRLHRTIPLVKVRDRDGDMCRAATLEVLDG